MNPNSSRRSGALIAILILAVSHENTSAQSTTNTTAGAVEPPGGTVFIPAVEPTAENAKQPGPGEPQPLVGDSRLEPEPGPVQATTGASVGSPLSGTSQLGGGPSLGSAAPQSETVLRLGPFGLRPSLAFRVSYGDNLQAAPGEHLNSFIYQLSPGILIEAGDRWSLSYTPDCRWYSNPGLKDTVDHRVMLNGGAVAGEWDFGLRQSFSRTTEPLIETGGETGQDTYGTSISARRPLNSKLSIDLGLNQDLRFIDTAPNSVRPLTDRASWWTMNWIDYQYIERLSFGLGAGFTYDHVKQGSDMTSEQIQGRLKWVPGVKLTLSASVGADIRQILDSPDLNMVSPIYGGSIDYQLFDTTSLFVSVSRTVTPSYFSDSVSESTGVSAGLNQRLLGRLFLSVNGGYTTRDYTSTGASGTSGSAVSNQETYSVGVSLTMAILKRGNVSLFYNKTFNQSAASAYNFDPQTVGGQVSYTF